MMLIKSVLIKTYYLEPMTKPVLSRYVLFSDFHRVRFSFNIVSRVMTFAKSSFYFPDLIGHVFIHSPILPLILPNVGLNM